MFILWKQFSDKPLFQNNKKILLESAIFLWTFSENDAAPDLFGDTNNEEEIVNKENWTAMCTLRGHLQDVIGLAWSPCSQYLASCSTDNTAIVFDVKKGEDISFLFSKLYYSKISDTKNISLI